ncbi:GNAT family N-acetyltransferase [Sphingomonas cannabina]|uniref:GNAT family N-acetyltransferase n=1 Tax=Sphingomonas cannabina TaxID=2899123 RepID=UPI001F26EACB|nr:GNAT family N-acetyltransferase [Sphingomonas cannabina]UIJ46250.1 GNAT family N-acetyltransferase [Sphingomonas cannabina]
MSRRPYAAPTPITADHRLDGFACGKSPLDDWLRAHALENEGKASRTYVVTAQAGEDAGNVVAYYTLAYGSVTREEVPKKIRQGLPNPVPVMVLGRLAVHRNHGGKGIGAGLLREAMQRTLDASLVAGLRALIVHALDDEAVGFYARYGFQVFPAGTRTLFLPVETLRQAVAG